MNVHGGSNLEASEQGWRRSLLIAMPFTSAAFLIGIPLNALAGQDNAFDHVVFPFMAVCILALHAFLVLKPKSTNAVQVILASACPVFFLGKLAYLLYSGDPNLDIPAEMTEGYFWIPALYLLGSFTQRSHRIPQVFLAGLLGMSLWYALQTASAARPDWSTLFALIELNLANVTLLLLSQSFIGFRDQYARAAAQADTLHDLAYTDTLTGLRNRTGVQTSLEALLGPGGGAVSVVFVDLDGFKAINDTLGYCVGDAVLRQVTGRWRQFCRERDELGRWSGDQFVMLLPGSSSDEAAQVAARLLAALEAPIAVDDHLVKLSASAGVSASPEHGTTAQELLRHADTALNAVKRNGKNGVRRFSRDLDSAFEEHQQLERDLRVALAERQFSLVYQPIVHLETGAVFKVETLLRWTHPTRGLVSPATFIPVAEASGLIVSVGEWILETACFEAARWNAPGGRPVRVAVNTSALQLAHPSFVGVVTSALVKSGLPAHLLELEITEGVVLQNAGLTLQALAELRELGVSLAIDDFGTGYSSLSYLRDLPVSTVKVDRAFVRDLGVPRHESPFAYALFDAILSIARSLNLEVVAEGIETEAQLATLRDLGCTGGQGYYFARPESAELLFERLQGPHRPVFGPGSAVTLN